MSTLYQGHNSSCPSWKRSEVNRKRLSIELLPLNQSQTTYAAVASGTAEWRSARGVCSQIKSLPSASNTSVNSTFHSQNGNTDILSNVYIKEIVTVLFQFENIILQEQKTNSEMLEEFKTITVNKVLSLMFLRVTQKENDMIIVILFPYFKNWSLMQTSHSKYVEMVAFSDDIELNQAYKSWIQICSVDLTRTQRDLKKDT